MCSSMGLNMVRLSILMITTLNDVLRLLGETSVENDEFNIEFVEVHISSVSIR